MTVPLPNLDDRQWADLVDEGRGLIPRYAPQWTDHNAHDPGITLLELLAYRTEQELFRVNAVGPAHRHAFLGLFGDRFAPAGTRPAVTLLAYQPDPRERRAADRVGAGAFLAPWPPPAETVPPADDGTVALPTRTSGGPPDDDPGRRIARPPLYRAAHDLDLTGIRVGAVQAFDGREFHDVTDVLARTQPAGAWGDDPADPTGRPADEQPALYVGLDLRLWAPPGKTDAGTALTLWFVPDGTDLARLAADSDGADPRFRPFHPGHAPPAHHGLTAVWEYQDGCGWRPVPDDGPFRDETHGFTRPGRVVIPTEVLLTRKPAEKVGPASRRPREHRTGETPAPPGSTEFLSPERVIGAVPSRHFYLRCRLVDGRSDAPPRLRGVFPDAVLVEQWDRAETPLTWAARRPGAELRLRDLVLPEPARFDVRDAAADLARRGWGSPAADWGGWVVSERGPARLWEGEPDGPGGVAGHVPFAVIGVGTGEPNQSLALPTPSRWPADNPFSEVTWNEDTPPAVIADSVELWTVEPDWGWDPAAGKGRAEHRWHRVADLRLCGRRTPGFVFEPEGNRVRFGDGEAGRVPPPGAVVAARYRWTAADPGPVPAGLGWARLADVELPRPGRPPDPPAVRFRNPFPAAGRPAEPLTAAVARLEAEFAATERLVGLAEKAGGDTLDGVDLAGVAPPPAAVGTLDIECLARTTPGTRVARARAWAGVDPSAPGLVTPGAVTVVVVPELPADRPEPTPGLLRAVAERLAGRRLIGCRVCVVGPEYQRVRVRVTVHTARGAGEKARDRVRKAIADLLHPLRGGPNGRGWPFGRDVHPGELLRAVTAVDGVRYVTDLRLAAGDGPWGEAAVRVGPRALAAAETEVDAREDA